MPHRQPCHSPLSSVPERSGTVRSVFRAASLCLILGSVSTLGHGSARRPAPLHPALEQFLQSAAEQLDRIDPPRRAQLEQLATLLATEATESQRIHVVFICTHNSRRSHLAHVWSMAAAQWLGLENFHSYSGGTETTAFNQRCFPALEAAGFRILPAPEAASDDSLLPAPRTLPNPQWRVSTSPDLAPQICFSKRYDDPINPSHDFVAVMVCDDADVACPLVPGAKHRVRLTYVDPKRSDDTPQQAETYAERSAQIAREMLYLVQRTVQWIDQREPAVSSHLRRE